MDPIKTDLYEEALALLTKWIEINDYNGYDPYDYLSAPIFKGIKDRRHLFYVQQIGKRLPFNLRKYLAIKRNSEPKGLALIISSYTRLYEQEHKREYILRAENLYKTLVRLKSPSHFAWGLSFPWASRNFYLDAYEPNIVTTCFVGRAILDLFKATKKGEYLKICGRIWDFIRKELHEVYNNGNSVCISYTQKDNSQIIDANALAADFIGNYGIIVESEEMLELTRKLIIYIDSKQQSEGYWIYGHLGNGDVINQLDYHQGFILDSYFNLIKGNVIEGNIGNLKRAADFYNEVLFNPEGSSYFRYPKKYPIDIHNQAQGILTFSKLSEINIKYLDFAERIAKWTISNMQGSEGFFYYQRWPVVTNKIPYMRWGQAWMFRALVELVCAIRHE